MTEHTVSYKVPGGTRDVTRQVFTSHGRILGTETETRQTWRGYDGMQTVSQTTDTRHFAHISEAQEWIDELFRDHETAGVKANGGTKLVIVL